MAASVGIASIGDGDCFCATFVMLISSGAFRGALALANAAGALALAGLQARLAAQA